jgi:hypothetical protein
MTATGQIRQYGCRFIGDRTLPKDHFGNVRFGSKADIGSHPNDVRFTLKADIRYGDPHV